MDVCYDDMYGMYDRMLSIKQKRATERTVSPDKNIFLTSSVLLSMVVAVLEKQRHNRGINSAVTHTNTNFAIFALKLITIIFALIFFYLGKKWKRNG